MKKVAYIASECVPFIKTGGLADVVGTLPKIFDKNEYDVRVIIPNYLCIPNKYREKMQYLTSFYMDIGYKNEYVGVMYLEYEGVKVYFIDNEYYFNGFTPYGDVKWDIEKFCYFSKAALCILPTIGFQPDIVHCHDWQAGLVPVYLKTLFAGNPFYSGMKSVMTIHNLQFQGKWDIETIQACSGLPDYVFTPDKLEISKDAAMLKGGLVYADKITTVSPTYSNEILTETYGERMDAVLRYRRGDLWGIVNGIDTDLWNPKTDKLLAKNFDVKSYASGKKANKLALQKKLGLEETDKKPLIGLVSRLTNQKGVYMITDRIREIMGMDVQFVVLGTGEANAENAFKWMEQEYKGQAVYYCGYNEDLAHLIYAASDLFLMPSLYEPCGIGQLIAMHYGALPVVRETGGLKDTVQPFNQYTGEGNGFSFWAANADDMIYTLRWAVEQYNTNKPGWKGLVKSAMTTDVSWNQSAGVYEQLYYEICNWPDE